MNDLRSILLGTLPLDVMAAVALAVTLLRVPRRADTAALRRLAVLAAVVVGVQACHFVEETSTRFYEAFPAMFDMPAWSMAFFVPFNLFWLVVWAVSIYGVLRGFRPAFFPIWFLAIASILNGVAHPGLALLIGGYFPGLVTAPVSGVLGVWLCVRLCRATSAR